MMAKATTIKNVLTAHNPVCPYSVAEEWKIHQPRKISSKITNRHAAERMPKSFVQ